MEKKFYHVADDMCIAATAQEAARFMNCDTEEVFFAHAIKNQRIGYCWVQVQGKKNLQIYPAFANNIFNNDIKNINKVKLEIFLEDNYFVKDDVFCLYSKTDKAIYKVDVIPSGKIAKKRAALQGIITERVFVAAINKKNLPKSHYAWIVKSNTGKMEIIPMFADDNDFWLDSQGKPVLKHELSVTCLEQGQMVTYKKKNYVVVHDLDYYLT